MAPKLKAIAELGAVERNGIGWRARVKDGGVSTLGPQRATRAEAQVDLDRARQSSSRSDTSTFLVSLAQQVRGEGNALQQLAAPVAEAIFIIQCSWIGASSNGYV